MTKEELQQHTKAFNVAIVRVCEVLPKTAAGFELAKQLIRSAGSEGSS
jgi:four helix bundle protein